MPCGDHRGRPPIHPRILAGIVLYGLTHRFRSSRVLEYMCRHNLDFIWLSDMDGRKSGNGSPGVGRVVRGAARPRGPLDRRTDKLGG